MRILYHHRVRSKDGQGVHISELIGAFRAAGHEVIVAEPSGFATSSFGGEPGTLSFLKRLLPKSIYEVAELGYNFAAFLRLDRLCRRHMPDIIYERYSLHLVAGALVRKWRKIPLILEVNAPLARERAEFGGLGLPRLGAVIEAWTWRQADHVLPVTGVLAEIVRKAGVPEPRVTVIPNGVNLTTFAEVPDPSAAKSRLGLSGKVVIGFTGFMRDWHGLDDLIAILSMPDTPANLHLLLVGDGPARLALERRTRELGVQDRVTFTGLVKRTEISCMIAAFDIALQPRAVDYASPLKIVEYLVFGKAIVAPDQANIREILVQGENALLFDTARCSDMAAAILRLASDAALRERLGTAARATVFYRQLTWANNARRVCAIASSLGGRHVGTRGKVPG